MWHDERLNVDVALLLLIGHRSIHSDFVRRLNWISSKKYETSTNMLRINTHTHTTVILIAYNTRQILLKEQI